LFLSRLNGGVATDDDLGVLVIDSDSDFGDIRVPKLLAELVGPTTVVRALISGKDEEEVQRQRAHQR